MKLSCCSLRRISRTRKIVFTIIPAIISAKKIKPKKSRTPSRQLRMIQPTLSATASATRPMPRQRKKTIVPRRLVMRMASQVDSTAFRAASARAFRFWDCPRFAFCVFDAMDSLLTSSRSKLAAMSELVPNTHRQQQLYWAQMVELKVASSYIRRYRDYLGKRVTGLGALRAIDFSGGIAAWALWKEHAFLWAAIIAASQVADALKEVFPFTKRHKAASEHTIPLGSIFIDAQLEWES